MTPAACIVAVDVGNTAVKLGVRQDDVVRTHAIAIGQSSWQSDVIQWVRGQFGCRQPHWRIASVHRKAAERLIQAIGQSAPEAGIDLVTYRDVPMPVRVDHPERLGIDRLLSAYAARQCWAAPLVVVDAGSAVTVDWVDRAGEFCGGAILPGLGLQAQALATGTDALPQIQWESCREVTLPATNTADAIYGGILIGVAACIDALFERYQAAPGNRAEGASLILTGGDSAALSPHLRSAHHRAPNLVCQGLLNLSDA